MLDISSPDQIERYSRNLGGWTRPLGQTYPVCDGRAHAGNHCDAPAITELNHLLRHCLRRHEDAGDVDIEHQVSILGRVFQRRSFLLDASRCNQAVHPSMRIGNGRDARVELLDITHVDTTVVKCCSELFCSALLNPGEIR